MVFTVLLLMSAAFLAPVIGQEIKFLEQQTSGIDGNLKVALTNGILENTQRGTYIGQLVAYVDGQSNSNIVYSKEIGGDNYLDVSPTGEVTTDAPLDRELSNANTILITFIATFETVETRAPIKISVLDKNDNIPIFERTEGLAVEVSEDVANGTMVFSNIFVSDLDLGWYAQIKMTCMVVPNDTKSAEACDTFGLSETPVNDPQNPDLKAQGFIYVKKALDYETQKEYTMTISAVDNPDKKGGGVSHPVTVNIAIDVFDEQDSPPVFSTNTLRAFVHEHSMVGKRLSSVTVRDGDRGNPRLLNISIIGMVDLQLNLSDIPYSVFAYCRVVFSWEQVSIVTSLVCERNVISF